MRFDELEEEYLAEIGPRRPPIRGGGQGTGRRDDILSRLIWGDSIVLDARNSASCGHFQQAGNQIGRASRMLTGLQGKGPWTSPATSARSWLTNARSFLAPRSRGIVLTNLGDAHNYLRMAIRNRRRQLGRP